MDRKIKFRVWDSEEKKMYYPDKWMNLVWVRGRLVYVGISDIHLYSPDLMQYIGFMNKDRKEIWEGDIMKNGNRIEVIKIPDIYELDALCISEEGESYTKQGEILGNIWENPEISEKYKIAKFVWDGTTLK